MRRRAPRQAALDWRRPGLTAGVDEAGRGPLAGPVVAAAVILDAARPIAGLADSKQLSPARREVLALDERLVVWDLFKADRDGFVEIVFCLESGKAMARQVTTGIQSEEWIEILGGLKEGEEVVSGSYRAISKDLENGTTVRVNNEKAPEKPGETASRE